MVIGGHVVKGHVPAAPIRKLLAEPPQIKGISLPGMTGRKTEPFMIHEISDGEPRY